MQDSEIFNPQLENVLLAQRLRLITAIFQACADWAEGFEIGQSSSHQTDTLIETFERTAACWTAQFLPGTTGLCIIQSCSRLMPTAEPTSSLEDLATTSRQSVLVSLGQDEELAKQAIQILKSVDSQWREGERLKLAHQRQELDRSLIQLLQQQITVHSWLHHDAHAEINSTTPCGLFMLNLNQSLSVFSPRVPLLSPVCHFFVVLAYHFRFFYFSLYL